MIVKKMVPQPDVVELWYLLKFHLYFEIVYSILHVSTIFFAKRNQVKLYSIHYVSEFYLLKHPTSASEKNNTALLGNRPLKYGIEKRYVTV